MTLWCAAVFLLCYNCLLPIVTDDQYVCLTRIEALGNQKTSAKAAGPAIQQCPYTAWQNYWIHVVNLVSKIYSLGDSHTSYTSKKFPKNLSTAVWVTFSDKQSKAETTFLAEIFWVCLIFDYRHLLITILRYWVLKRLLYPSNRVLVLRTSWSTHHKCAPEVSSSLSPAYFSFYDCKWSDAVLSSHTLQLPGEQGVKIVTNSTKSRICYVGVEFHPWMARLTSQICPFENVFTPVCIENL